MVPPCQLITSFSFFFFCWRREGKPELGGALTPDLSSFVQRYYGKSLPFGDASFTVPQVGLLTVEQALADYAVLICELREQLGATRCPVIVFGGRWEEEERSQ